MYSYGTATHVQPRMNASCSDRWPLLHCLHLNHIASLYEMLSLTLPILLFASPISVFACEGECMKGVTLAWLTNYTSLIDPVFKHIVRCRAAPRIPPLTFRRPCKSHTTCSRLKVTTTRCHTCNPSYQRTKARTRA